MDLRYDLWHLAFVYVVTHGAPPNFEVQSEIRLTIEPQRADMLLLRRKDVERQDERATVLCGLWQWLGKVTVLEYKSPVNYAFKPGDLLRLVAYGMLYDIGHLDELPTRDDLTLVLVVASVTPTLRREIERMGATFVPIGGGYARIEGMMYTCLVAVIDEVCETEREEYLEMFSHRPVMSEKNRQWIGQWRREAKMKGSTIEDLRDFDEWFQSVLDRMPLEKRFAGLAAEQVVLVMPVAILRGLTADYLRSLPTDVQEKIRKRLQEETH